MSYDWQQQTENIRPLLDTIIDEIPEAPYREGDPQMQITSLQEETKRMRDNAKAINDAQTLVQKSLDSIRDFIADQTKTEAQYGVNVPGGTVEGDEELAERAVQ